MANKLSISIDAEKARQLIETRSYKNKEGVDVNVKEIKFDLVEMKPESRKVLYDGDKLQMVKTHFAVKQQTKDDRDSKVPVEYVGEGVSYEFKNQNNSQQASLQPVGNVVEVQDDLPF
jgi:hypothetical protein